MKRLKELREEKSITQVRLGIELGVSQETISGYEINKAVPPADMLIKLADYLDTSVDYLLGRTDVKKYTTINKSDLTYLELELINLFRQLPDLKKERVLGFIFGMLEK